MKTKPHYLMMALVVVVLTAVTWSCDKDDDPSLAQLRDDKIQYLEDSLRISDSLRLTGDAGIVNYGIVVVDGSTSTIFANGGSRSKDTKTAVSDAIVTISQYGKTLTDTTDASGLVVFNGFFRSAATVTIRKTGYTSVSYISAVHIQDSTRTGTISFVGNLIPVFATSGANTATISGVVTIESNLTNTIREFVPTGTTLTATIDARDDDFASKFLTTDIENEGAYVSSCGCQFVYVGNIKQASYQAAAGIGTTDANGAYSITVPAAIDGLPISLQYSDIALTQTLFQLNASSQPVSVTRRAIFIPGAGVISLNPIPGGAGNTPDAGDEEVVIATRGSGIETKSGLKYVNDVHYGTGM